MNEIVKYNNSLNCVSFRKFNQSELDLFMVMCHKMKDKGNERLTFKFSELKSLCDYSRTANIDFFNIITSTYDKMLGLNLRIGTETEYVKFVLFNEYEVSLERKELTVGINEKFQFILNDLSNNFTRFELNEFVGLKSTYSKSLYRQLKQYRNTGCWRINIDEFRRLMDIPDSYRMSHINSKVLTMAKSELSSIFKDLEVEKIKGSDNKKIQTLVFKFTPDIVPSDPIEDEHNLKEKKKRTVSKNKKNISEKNFRKTAFHNFNSNLSKYNSDELNEMVYKKNKNIPTLEDLEERLKMYEDRLENGDTSSYLNMCIEETKKSIEKLKKEKKKKKNTNI